MRRSAPKITVFCIIVDPESPKRKQQQNRELAAAAAAKNVISFFLFSPAFSLGVAVGTASDL